MHTLKYDSELTRIKFTLMDNHASWRDVADLFFDYLVGSGFILSRSDLSDHYNEDTYVQGDDTQRESGDGGEATEREEAEERASTAGVQDQGARDQPASSAYIRCGCRFCIAAEEEG